MSALRTQISVGSDLWRRFKRGGIGLIALSLSIIPKQSTVARNCEFKRLRWIHISGHEYLRVGVIAVQRLEGSFGASYKIHALWQSNGEICGRERYSRLERVRTAVRQVITHLESRATGTQRKN